MWFIVLGVILIALKLADISVVAAWSWWLVLAPFGCALAWWAYADSTGLTKRREMDKLENRKLERRRRSLEALGIDRDAQKRDEAAQRTRRVAATREEGKRTKTRQANEKLIRDSVFDSQNSSTFEDSRQEKPR
jgi:small Trp-rich protein